MATTELRFPALPPPLPGLSERGWQTKQRAAAFVERELHPAERRIAERGGVDRNEVRALRERARAEGFANLNMPEELGGGGFTMFEQVALEEEAGKATNGLGFVVADRGPRELLELASPEQVERYVRPVMRYEAREAWAVTEPGAGSDVAAIAASARRNGDGWLLSGEKWFVTGAEEATFLVVLARGEDGAQTLFLVDRHAPGIETVRIPGFMHDPYLFEHHELRLHDVAVPEHDRLPGGEAARSWFSVERLMIAARSCGASQRLLALARDWAEERVAFGGPIAGHQGVQFMLADSLVDLAAARMLTYAAAAAVDDESAEGAVVHGKIALAKLHASEAAGRIADRVLQIFGGRGYMSEHPAERYYRELRVDRIWEGTSEIQRVILARGLRKRGIEPYLT